jgi:hypothetical protein
LRATELLSGWMKRTASPTPMLKLCQLIATFWLDWVMVVLPGELLMPALPAATTPPTGKAWTSLANGRISESTRAFSIKFTTALFARVQRDTFLPAVLAISETATHVPVLAFQSDR